MSKIFATKYFKSGLLAAVFLTVGFGLILGLAPRKLTKVLADDGCQPVYSDAVFDPYTPYSWTDQAGSNCKDFAPLSAGLTTDTQWHDTVQANIGDQIRLRVYVHNGAASNSGSVMHNMQYSVNLDTSAGSSHTVTATLSASNAQSLNSQVLINTPAGATLQVVAGNLQQNIGDMQPCFNFSQQFFITLKVVGSPPVQQKGTGSIHAKLDGQLFNQCLQIGIVSWSTQNVTSAEVYVVDPDTQQEKLFASGLNSNGANASWIQPNKTYVFILYDTSGGAKTELSRDSITGNLSCGTKPTGQNAITFTPGGQLGSQCLRTGTASWTDASDVKSVDVTAWDTLIPSNVNSLTGANGTPNSQSSTNWLVPGRTYVFVMYNTTGGQHTELTRITTDKIADLNCGAPTPSSFNLSITPNPVCVGSKSSVSITNATSDLNGKQVFWDSTLNGSPTGEHLSGYNQFISNGSWSGQTDPWTASEIGSWTKTATIGSVSQTASFVVKDCSVPPQTLSCSLSPNPAQVNQLVTLAISTSGDYNWSAPGISGFSAYGVGNNNNSPVFSYTSAGGKTVTVTKNGQTATCNVTIQGAPAASSFNLSITPNPVCVGSKSSVSITNATSDLNGKQVFWDSTLNGSPTGEHLSGYNQFISNGSWSGQTDPWTTAEIGSWTKTASFVDSNGNALARQTVSFAVQDCSQPPQPGSFTATATATASASASAYCSSNSSIASASASASATATATSNISQADAQSKAQVQAQQQAQAQAQVNANAQASAQCPAVGNPPPSNTTTTNTNTNTNTCVNNSCNTSNSNTSTYYYSAANNSNPYYYNNPVPYNQYVQLGIQKEVRNVTAGGSFQKTVGANVNDTVQFQIIVTNTGNQSVSNVTLTDAAVSGLQWISGSTQVSGGYYNNAYNSGSNWYGNNLNLGTLSTGQSVTMTFQAQVTAGSGTSIENVASVYGSGVSSVQDDAWVFVNGSGNVLGGNVNLVYSKKTWNDTKNVDATTQPAAKEDYITYTLTVVNNGNSPATNFVITDDLSQVLPYADISDNGGGTVSGNVISYPPTTVPAGGSVSESFRVRIKYVLASNLHYVMTNTYGNTVTVNINTPQVAGAFIAPKTGADTNAFAFAGLMLTAFAVVKKRKALLKFLGR